MLRRKRLPPVLAPVHERFLVVLGHVEQAKEALVEAAPSARAPGRPLADALFAFDASVRAAAEAMAGWHDDALGAEWEACSAGIDEALAASERLRLEAPDLGHESLLFRVGDLIGPLEAFERAVERFRTLRE